MRKILILTTIILLMCTINVVATSICGEWAKPYVENALSKKIITYDDTRNYYSPITRLEIANLIAESYYKVKVQSPLSEVIKFTDISHPNVNLVAALNIMSGYGDGTFMPNNTTSRQEMAKILLHYQSVIYGTPIILNDNQVTTLTDYGYISDWAKPYVNTAINSGLLNGYEDGTFKGQQPVSWQEAIVMIERISLPGDNEMTISNIPKLSQDFNLKIKLNENTANISWNVVNNSEHTLTITEQRRSRYENDIPPNDSMVISFNNETEYTFKTNPNKKYFIRISCQELYYEDEFYTEKLHFDDMDTIYSSYPTNITEAESLMVDITIPIWTLNNSEKIASTITFKTHSGIAEKIKLIFEEIFNGKEKFPIKDIGCYSWRGGISEHNGGTAIDINSNENYCTYNDGTTIGSHWTPYEDPYSIPPYGDVVNAFEKYGFTWGGDSWSNPKDYMHFSYLGT